MKTEGKLTARQAPQSLREHAIAFWNYYNPSGRRLDEVDIELNEESLNGLLLSTVLSQSMDMATYQRRVARAVEFSQGVLSRNAVQRLLKRAIGFDGKVKMLLEALKHGPVQNPHYGDGSRIVNAATRGIAQTSKHFSNKRAALAEDMTDEKIIETLMTSSLLNRTDVMRAVRMLHIRRRALKESGEPVQASKAAVLQYVAVALGYRRWHDMFRVCLAMDCVANLIHTPRDDIEDLLLQGKSIELNSECIVAELKHRPKE